MVAGVRRACPGSAVVWRGGLLRSSASTSMCGWCSAGLARLGGLGWSLGHYKPGPLCSPMFLSAETLVCPLFR